MLNKWVAAVSVYCYTMKGELYSLSNIHTVIAQPLQIINWAQPDSFPCIKSVLSVHSPPQKLIFTLRPTPLYYDTQCDIVSQIIWWEYLEERHLNLFGKKRKSGGDRNYKNIQSPCCKLKADHIYSHAYICRRSHLTTAAHYGLVSAAKAFHSAFCHSIEVADKTALLNHCNSMSKTLHTCTVSQGY